MWLTQTRRTLLGTAKRQRCLVLFFFRKRGSRKNWLVSFCFPLKQRPKMIALVAPSTAQPEPPWPQFGRWSAASWPRYLEAYISQVSACGPWKLWPCAAQRGCHKWLLSLTTERSTIQRSHAWIPNIFLVVQHLASQSVNHFNSISLKLTNWKSGMLQQGTWTTFLWW